MDDIDRTMVIDPARVGRMASSRADGRSTTLYGRHRKGAGRPRKARPERPVEPFMAALMTVFAALWLAGMLAAVCAAAAVLSTVPAWTYLARYGRERHHGL